nr:5'(3')-deoxyribonucleotidase, mitochondrial [Vicugna pacos]
MAVIKKQKIENVGETVMKLEALYIAASWYRLLTHIRGNYGRRTQGTVPFPSLTPTPGPGSPTHNAVGSGVTQSCATSSPPDSRTVHLPDEKPVPASRRPVVSGLDARLWFPHCGHSEKAISIWETENFFFDLEPLPGAVEAVKQMANLESTDVFICTSPIKMYKYCPFEKYAWVEKHFGPDFLEQIVLTRDKTVVSADLLIDDRVDITGAEPNPSWEHVVFTACHNRHTQLQPPSRRLHSWADDWKAILDSKRPR